MQFKIGMVVKSNAGHDKNRFYVLIGLESGCGSIADGKRRKLEKPKSKKLIHLRATNVVLEMADLDTNQKIRRALHSYNYGNEAMSVAE